MIYIYINTYIEILRILEQFGTENYKLNVNQIFYKFWRFKVKMFQYSQIKICPGRECFKSLNFHTTEVSPPFLNTGTTGESFQQSAKQDYFPLENRHIMKSSTIMYEVLGSQFSRIESNQDQTPLMLLWHF